MKYKKVGSERRKMNKGILTFDKLVEISIDESYIIENAVDQYIKMHNVKGTDIVSKEDLKAICTLSKSLGAYKDDIKEFVTDCNEYPKENTSLDFDSVSDFISKSCFSHLTVVLPKDKLSWVLDGIMNEDDNIVISGAELSEESKDLTAIKINASLEQWVKDVFSYKMNTRTAFIIMSEEDYWLILCDTKNIEPYFTTPDVLADYYNGVVSLDGKDLNAKEFTSKFKMNSNCLISYKNYASLSSDTQKELDELISCEGKLTDWSPFAFCLTEEGIQLMQVQDW